MAGSISPSITTPQNDKPTETCDLHSASDEYATRFGGATGAWMLSVQESMLFECIGSDSSISILDVGGGHGQIGYPLLNRGFAVTVLGSSSEALKQFNGVTNDRITLATGPLLALPFKDRQFDVVTSFRIVSHCDDWQLLLRELCRVARRSIVFDYPTTRSINAVSSLFFKFKKNLEGNTRPFIVFNDRQLVEVLDKEGFEIERRDAQFFLPMVIHRKIGIPAISRALEWVPRTVGLTGLFGSPIILKATRKELSE